MYEMYRPNCGFHHYDKTLFESEDTWYFLQRPQLEDLIPRLNEVCNEYDSVEVKTVKQSPKPTFPEGLMSIKNN